MLLWDYQDAGFTHYCLLTEGENCDACSRLEGLAFPIGAARVGMNFTPMHPNCDCRVGVLDDAGRIAYIISGGKAEKNEEETNWYDAFLQIPQDAKELFLAFVSSQNERWNRKDVAGFLDWLTLGIHIRDLKGNVCMRIDPPDKITQYPHVHIYDSDGNLLNIAGNIVDRKSPAGHIPYKEN